MNSKIVSILMVSFLAHQGVARLLFGTCPNFELPENFDIKRYAGEWYEQARDVHTFYESFDCVKGDYDV